MFSYEGLFAASLIISIFIMLFMLFYLSELNRAKKYIKPCFVLVFVYAVITVFIVLPVFLYDVIIWFLSM